MIPLSTFNILVAVVVLLSIYAWIDHRNKLYGNIVAAIISAMVASLLAILIYIGAVENDAGTAVNDMSTAGILLFISVVMWVYSFFMAWDAKEEYDKMREEL